MTIAIELPAGMESKLLAHATATGKNVEALVIEAVEARLSLSQLSFRDILGPVHEDFRKSGMSKQDLDHLIYEARTEAWSARHAASKSSA